MIQPESPVTIAVAGLASVAIAAAAIAWLRRRRPGFMERIRRQGY